jgi:predicted DCC family thiol-disulfide oxidoreductase YuxK
MSEPERPLMLYDGNCDFCRLWIARWRRVTGDAVEYLPAQQVSSRFPEVPLSKFAEAVQLREPDGRWSSGAEAVYRALSHARGAPAPGAPAEGGSWSGPASGAWIALYRGLPPFAWASEFGYRVIARNRPFFTRVTRWVWGEHVTPPGQRLTAWIFLRLLGLISLSAFVSLWVQVMGLIGRDGILPAAEFIGAVKQRYGMSAMLALPSLCWFNASDAMLHALCAAGVVASLALALGVLAVPSLLVIAVSYVSLASVAREFLWFQWDGLLVETVVAAMLLAPWRWLSRPATDPAPPRSGLWLLRWLLFRLMFSSAVVKLASGDKTWRNLTALQFHYETQPLPPWTAWWAHHLPGGFQTFSAATMFAVEGLAPFLILAPRRIRFAGAAAMLGLQTLIVVTGNYGFFNPLAMALCIPLLDDGAWPAWLRNAAGLPTVEIAPVARTATFASRWIRRPAAVALALIGLVPLCGALRWPLRLLGPLPLAYEIVAPYRAVNSYGLFAVMTTDRPEIVIEGSNDGEVWRAYEFKWKPGELDRRPRFVAPHMPRLDWQMWFAALGGLRDNSWLLYFCERLLQGSKPVLALMAKDPFPDAPPRYLRANVYLYHFTTAAQRGANGAWWTRELRGPYTPPLTLRDGRLSIADLPGSEPGLQEGPGPH